MLFHWRTCILILLFFFVAQLANGQELNSLRCKRIAYTTDTFKLDTLAVFLDNEQKSVIGIVGANRAYFKVILFNQDSVSICYRVLLDNRLVKEYQLHDVLENDQTPRPISYNPNKETSKSAGDKIFSSGSVSRGISAGNNQGLLVNSDLNLQMQGDLGKGVILTAAVSDNNSPLQPDGTTLQIQDFDKVFVKIAKDSWFAVAGDYFMQSERDNHFLAFNKKSRGLQFEGVFNSPKGYRVINQTHAAVSRGRFARNEIQGSEGLQGPYRLTGTKNEAFIIVIAATEVVYLDGRPLVRGEQNDYVINYNSAELSFNPNTLITGNSRIVVEFQYADQSYSRILFNEGLGVEKGKLKMRFNYFLEQDNKNQPFQAESALSLFDSSQNQDAKQVLSKAGDNKANAVISTQKIITNFDNSKILYRKVDSMTFKDVLVYQPTDNGDANFFTASFSNVGQGSGNYIQLQSSANGRVYAWVSPIAGVPQGNYEPVIALVAPIRQQFATAQATYQLTQKTLVKGELAFSQFDNNTFSVLDKRDDDAFGSFFELKDTRFTKDSLKWQNNVSWEQVSKGFAFIERYRNVEFDRIWNRSLSNPNTKRIDAKEQIINLDGKLSRGSNFLGYELPVYKVGNTFLGYSPKLTMQQKFAKRWVVNSAANLMQAAVTDSLKNQAYLASAALSYRASDKLSLSVFGKTEKNTSRLVLLDSLARNSFNYESVGLNMQTKLSEVWKIGAQADYRKNELPLKNDFAWAVDAYNLHLDIARSKGNKRLQFVSNARFLKQNTNVFNKANEQYLLQRIDYQDNNNKKGYQLNVYLQSGSGREQKREFVFLEVPAGLGQYSWIDYNGNNVKEINEFEFAVFKDQAKYIRVYNLTNDFIQSNQHEANLSLKLRPVNWFKTNKPSKLLQNITNQSNIRVNQQNTAKNLLLLNPLKQDTLILSSNNLIRNTLLYNGSKLGLELTDKTSSTKQLLTYGAEQNIKTEHIFKTRYTFVSQWQIEGSASLENRELVNKFFENRNFSWSANQYNIALTRQVVTQRISLAYTQTFGNGSENGADSLKLTSNKIELNYFYNVDKVTSLDASLGRTDIEFNGNATSPLGFQILSGLVQGVNYNWTINLRTLISKNIQFTFGYEGRKLPELAIIHIGRMEARYLF